MSAKPFRFRKPPRAVVSQRRKINWLLRHPALWEGFPRDGGPAKWNHRERIVTAMKEAGLYSKTTNWFDVNVERLISDARRVRRERFYKINTGTTYAKTQETGV